MQIFTEASKDIPVSYDADVLVCGSGPAGIAAALASARSGADTVIIESMGDIGGISTTGLMSHWTGRAYSPIYLEILRRSAERNEGEFKDNIVNMIDPEKLKTLYLDMLEEAGAKILLYTFASDAVVENNKVCGVIVENKSGRSLIRAKVVIDATGDGDIAYKAGADYIKGRESDGRMQPCTVMFKVGGVDYSRAVFPGSFETLVPTEKGELQSLGKEIIGHPAGHVLLYKSTLPGVVTCNMTNCIDIDGTKAEDMTRATVICRRQIEKIVSFLREYAPGYENCYCISSASLIGIRETRHFKGVYTITEDDILEARQFEDWIVRDAHFNFDIHNIEGAGLDKNGVQHKFTQTKGYTVPYRCLIPEKIDGLILAGRCISGTHKAHSNYRVMPICVGMGEGAGYAASISVKKNILPREVNVKEIQQYIIDSEENK
ncbi:MAG: FAD-dependent oxidoreductase [Ruminococcaceae bacterium]|nr:FAD-dependent oxidoreductase [Oscillospiraceae bacterium]